MWAGSGSAALVLALGLALLAATTRVLELACRPHLGGHLVALLHRAVVAGRRVVQPRRSHRSLQAFGPDGLGRFEAVLRPGLDRGQDLAGLGLGSGLLGVDLDLDVE